MSAKQEHQDNSKKIKHLTVLVQRECEGNELKHHFGIRPPKYIFIRKTLCGLEIQPFKSEIESLVGFPTSEDLICKECLKIHKRIEIEIIEGK